MWDDESECRKRKPSAGLLNLLHFPYSTDRVSQRLVEMGINPAVHRLPSSKLTSGPPHPGRLSTAGILHQQGKTDLSTAQKKLEGAIDKNLQKEIIDGLFSG